MNLFSVLFLVLPFLVVTKTVPTWNTTWPNISINASAGLPVLANDVYTIYNASLKDGSRNPNGTYNHGPIIQYFNGNFYCSWYNSPQNESQFMRVLYSKSPNGKIWSDPIEVFPNISNKGNENEPFFVINNHLYFSSSFNISFPALMRLYFDNNDTFSDIFWLSNSVPKRYSNLGYKSYLDMNDEIKTDMEIYLASLYNTTLYDNSKYNERSMYMIPLSANENTQQFMLLLRVSGSYQRLFSSTCFIDTPENYTLPVIECRPGTDLVLYNLVEFINNEQQYINNCNWSIGVETNIPDATSRTCVSILPDNRVYMLGNQLDKADDNNINQPRDVLVLSISNDGFSFIKAYCIRYNPPKAKFYGKYKDPGFEYPGGYWDSNYLYVTYSVNKEDIQISIIPLDEIKS